MLGTDQSYVLLFHDEKDDNKKGLLYNCLKISLSLAFIVSLLLFFFKEQVSIYLFGKTYNTLIYIIIVSIYAYIINNLLVRTIQMLQYSKMYSFLIIVNKITELFIILFALYALSNNISILSDSFYYLVLSKVLGVALATIFAIYFLINHLKAGPSLAENSIRKILDYSFPLMLTMIAFWLFRAIDRFSLKLFPSELGIYGAGFQIVNIITFITIPFANFWISIAFKKYKESPADTEFFKKIFKIIFITIFIIAIGLILFKDLAVYILLGEKFQEAKRIIPFLLLSVIMYIIAEVTGIGLLFKKKVVLNSFIIIAACLFNFVGNYYLVPIFKGVGAAISTGLSYIIYCLLRTIVSAFYYKVEYAFKQLAVTTFLYIIYATYATFYDNIYISSLLGVAFITYILLLNRKFIIKNLKQVF